MPRAPIGPDADPRPLHRQPWAVAAVGLGGLVGTALRYGAGVLVPAAPAGWPWATFTVNVVGAFVLAALLVALARLGPDTGRRRAIRLAVGTGLLGSFTTYSALAAETVHLSGFGSPALAAAYAVGTVVAGLAAAGLGFVAGRWSTPEPVR